MAETRCPSCGKAYKRLPEDRPVTVTCSPGRGGCGTTFVFPSIERSTMRVKCAKNGRAFSVQFNRKMPTHRFAIEQITIPTTVSSERVMPAGNQTRSFNADAYDWTGFYCPVCGYAPESGGCETIIQCGSCHDLVCMGLSYRKRDENGEVVIWAGCHPQCGGGGVLDGRIQSFSATWSSTTRQAPAAGLPNASPTTFKIGKGR